MSVPRNVEHWRSLVSRYFPAPQVDKALRVMACESGGNPGAIGDKSLTYWQAGTEYGYSVGLMQIRYLKGRPEKQWLLNSENNIKYAAGMWRAQGFGPWTCATILGIR